MNIIINAVFADEKPRGPGKYTNNLIKGLSEIDNYNEYYIYYGCWMKNYAFTKIKKDNFHLIELNIRNSQIFRNFYLAFILPIICKKYNPDLFFLLDTQAIGIKPCTLLSTIHDLAEFEVPQKYSIIQAFVRRCIVKNQIRLSDCILTVSEYSKHDICQRFHLKDDNVKVTYNIFDLPISQLSEQPENYFLFVGEIERAKNLSVLLRAFALLDIEKRKKFQIRVVGRKGNDYQNMLELANELGISDNIIFYGYVSDDELSELYNKCYSFVFPSLFEGFGIPVLEAMALGVPVICSNAASIPEVGGEAVLLFDPNDEYMLKSQLDKIIDTPMLRQKLIEKGKIQAKKFQNNNGVEKTYEILMEYKGTGHG